MTTRWKVRLERLTAGLVRALPSSVSKFLTPEQRARFEFIRGHHKHFYPLGGPMNGQAHRLEIARSIIERCGIAAIIETGTHRGSTTAWLAQFDLPVHSVELDPQFHAFAALRLAQMRNVSLERGDSVAFLTALGGRQWASGPIFIYLDAHWGERLPLAEEIRIIEKCFPRAIVMIDDFAVPGDAGYGFDDYGPGKALTLDYLKPLLGPATALFWPRASARWETGAKRGCVILTSDGKMRELLAQLPCLRPMASVAS